jgi:glycosyltransferase involved in cell wall biosynthesis
MNVLFLVPQLPWPAHQGTTIRNFGLISHLSKAHTIDLISFLAPGQSLAADNPLHQICRQIGVIQQPVRPTSARLANTLFSLQPDMALRLASRSMESLVADWVFNGAYDIVQAEGIEMASYGMLAQQVAAEEGRPVHFVFDDHNCEYLLQKRNALTDLRSVRRFPAGVYSVIQWQKLVRHERAICRRADAVLAVSQPDADALRALDANLRVEVIPNGIDFADYPAADTLEPPAEVLVFSGKMDYRPNVDAVLWFADEVLPQILAVRPSVRFQIVGQSPHARLERLRANSAIEITGAVADVRPYLRNAGVYVMPLRVGGGTRFKALEAMALGKAIVTTSLGVEGIGVQNGRELLIADDPALFAQAALTLLDAAQAPLRAHLGEAARRHVSQVYDWQEIIGALNGVYTRLAS